MGESRQPPGTKGGNIGLDLLNEFLNKDFKDLLNRSSGQYTDQQVQRRSKLSGEFGKHFDRLFLHSMVARHDSGVKKKRMMNQEDVRALVDLYKEDKLFHYSKDRYHSGYPGFTAAVTCKDPVKLGRRLRCLSEERDLWRDDAPRQ